MKVWNGVSRVWFSTVPADDRDPSIVQLPDGRLLSTFFHSVGVDWKGTWYTISEDTGKIWSTPEKLTPANYFSSSPVRVLKDRTLILPLYRYEKEIANGAVMISRDLGKSWSAPVNIDSAGEFLDAETDVIELTDGCLFAVQRGTYTFMHSSISKDRGQTWSRSEPLDFRGISPYLLRAGNGMILMVYGQIGAGEQNGTVIRWSTDECQTWSEAVYIAKPAGSHPTMVNLNDGSVLAVYYDQGRECDIRARRCIVTEQGVRCQ